MGFFFKGSESDASAWSSGSERTGEKKQGELANRNALTDRIAAGGDVGAHDDVRVTTRSFATPRASRRVGNE